MNILLISYIFYPEPIAMSQIVKDIASELSAKGHNVTVITSKPCRPYSYDFKDGTTENSWQFKRFILKSYSYPKSGMLGRFIENLSFGIASAIYIRNNHKKIDVIYACTFPLFSQKTIVKKAKKYSTPILIHLEDIYPEPLKNKGPFVGKILYNFLLSIDKWGLQNSSKVLTIGPKLKDYIVKTRDLKTDKVDFAYNWQDHNKFTERQGIKTIHSSIFTFMYCGSLSYATNIEHILKSFIKSNLKGCRFVIAGSGVLKDRLEIIAKNHNNIEFWEAQSDKIPDIQSQANVLILPLKKGIALRAFPSKLPAYLFSAKPVLAIVEKQSDVGELINNNSCGWTVEPENTEMLVEKFRYIYKLDPVVLLNMGEAGFRFSINNLTKEKNLSKVINILTSLHKQ